MWLSRLALLSVLSLAGVWVAGFVVAAVYLDQAEDRLRNSVEAHREGLRAVLREELRRRDAEQQLNPTLVRVVDCDVVLRVAVEQRLFDPPLRVAHEQTTKPLKVEVAEVAPAVWLRLSDEMRGLSDEFGGLRLFQPLKVDLVSIDGKPFDSLMRQPPLPVTVK